MEILSRCKCEQCSGTGVVNNPMWEEFFLEENKTGRAWEIEEVKEWFSERGCYSLPPEEPTCQNCEGEGVIEAWIGIGEILKSTNA